MFIIAQLPKKSNDIDEIVEIILVSAEPSEELILSFSDHRGGARIIYLHENSELNVFFMYNYTSANNAGYHWMDYVNGTNVYTIPQSPSREGHAFLGWYLEPQGINPWNNQMPASADEILRVYAKWQRN